MVSLSHMFYICRMRQRAGLLLLLFLLHNTAFNQLLKLPTLVAHFQEHQQRNEGIGIAEFLCMHYCGPDINDDDDDRDRQLPYKNITSGTIQHTFIPLAKPVSIHCTSITTSCVPYILLKDHNIPDPALAALFRPPRTHF